MKILIIDEEFPYPLNTGKRLRTYNLTRELEKNNEIHYLAFGTNNSESFEHFQQQNFNPHSVQPLNRKQAGVGFYSKLLVNLFSPLPYIVTSHYSDNFKQALIQLHNEHAFDVIIWICYPWISKQVSNAKREN